MARVRKPKVDKSGRTSAGILLWRRRAGRLEVLLGHPGGPYFAGKDADHWTVLKGEVDPGEDLLEVARRVRGGDGARTAEGSRDRARRHPPEVRQARPRLGGGRRP